MAVIQGKEKTMKTVKKFLAVALVAVLAAATSACCGFGGCGSSQPELGDQPVETAELK